MVMHSLLLVAGLAALTVGAEGLVRGSASLARRLGLTPLVIGLTIVAFGTSAPELVVSVNATLTGQGDIAVGNVVGSNIFNIAIILGLAAMICPIPVSLTVIKLDAPVMIAVSFLGFALISRGTIPQPVGFVLVGALAAYTAGIVWLARRQATAAAAEEFAAGVPAVSGSLWRDLAAIVIGLGLLVLGSRLLVLAAVAIARTVGVSEAVIGLTVVAAGTSLPELATSVVAALRRQPDLAVGNIVGSNLFNLLGILGTAAAIRPLSAPGILRLDLVAMVAFAVLLLPMMYTGRRLQRWEGAILLLGYAAYFLIRWP